MHKSLPEIPASHEPPAESPYPLALIGNVFLTPLFTLARARTLLQRLATPQDDGDVMRQGMVKTLLTCEALLATVVFQKRR